MNKVFFQWLGLVGVISAVCSSCESQDASERTMLLGRLRDVTIIVSDYYSDSSNDLISLSDLGKLYDVDKEEWNRCLSFGDESVLLRYRKGVNISEMNAGDILLETDEFHVSGRKFHVEIYKHKDPGFSYSLKEHKE